MNAYVTYLSEIIRTAFQSFAFSSSTAFISFKQKLVHFGGGGLFYARYEGRDFSAPETVWHVLAQEGAKWAQAGGNAAAVNLVLQVLEGFARERGISFSRSLLIQDTEGVSGLERLLNSGCFELQEWAVEQVYEAIRCGDVERLKHYVEKIPELKKDYGVQLLGFIARECREEALGCAEFLLSVGVISSERFGEKWERLLMLAKQSGNMAFLAWGRLKRCFQLAADSPTFTQQELKRYLAEIPELLTARDAAGDTALHWACRRGWGEASLVLLKAGADPFCGNFVGESGLAVALKNLPQQFAQQFLFEIVQPLSEFKTWEALEQTLQDLPFDSERFALERKLHLLQMQLNWLTLKKSDPDSNTDTEIEVNTPAWEALELKEKCALEALTGQWIGRLSQELDQKKLSVQEQEGRLRVFKKSILDTLRPYRLREYETRSLKQMHENIQAEITNLESKIAEEKQTFQQQHTKAQLWKQSIASWCQHMRDGTMTAFRPPEAFQLKPLWLQIFGACGVDFDRERKFCEALLTHAERQQETETAGLLIFLLRGRQFADKEKRNTGLHHAIKLRAKQSTYNMLAVHQKSLFTQNKKGETAFSLLMQWGDEALLQQAIRALLPNPQKIKPELIRQLMKTQNCLSSVWMEREPLAAPLLILCGLSHLRTPEGHTAWHYVVLHQQWEWVIAQEGDGVLKKLMEQNPQGLRPIELLGVRGGKTAWPFAQKLAQQTIQYRNARRQEVQAAYRKVQDPAQELYQAIDQLDVQGVQSVLTQGFSTKSLTWLHDTPVKRAWRKLFDFICVKEVKPSDILQRKEVHAALENLWNLLIYGFAPIAETEEFKAVKNTGYEQFFSEINFFEQIQDLSALRDTVLLMVKQLPFEMWSQSVKNFCERTSALSEIAQKSSCLHRFIPRLQNPLELLRDTKGNHLLHLAAQRGGEDVIAAIQQSVIWKLDPWELRNAEGSSVMEYVLAGPESPELYQALEQGFLQNLITHGSTHWVLHYPPIGSETEGKALLHRVTAVQGSERMKCALLTSVNDIPEQAWLSLEASTLFSQTGPVVQVLHEHWQSAFLGAVTAGRMDVAESLLQWCVSPDTQECWRSLVARGVLWNEDTLERVCAWVASYQFVCVDFSGAGVWTDTALRSLAGSRSLKRLDLSHGMLNSDQLKVFLAGLKQRHTVFLEFLDVSYNHLNGNVKSEFCEYINHLTDAGKDVDQCVRVLGNPLLEAKLQSKIRDVFVFPEAFASASAVFSEIWEVLQTVPRKLPSYTQSLKPALNQKKRKEKEQKPVLSLLSWKFEATRILQRDLVHAVLREAAATEQLAQPVRLQQLLAWIEAIFLQNQAMGAFLRSEAWFLELWRYVKQMHYVAVCQEWKASNNLVRMQVPSNVSAVLDFSQSLFSYAQELLGRIRQCVDIARTADSSHTGLKRWFAGSSPNRILTELQKCVPSFVQYFNALQDIPKREKFFQMIRARQVGSQQEQLQWNERLEYLCSTLGDLSKRHPTKAKAFLGKLTATLVDAYGRQLSLWIANVSVQEVYAFRQAVSHYLLLCLFSMRKKGRRNSNSLEILSQNHIDWMRDTLLLSKRCTVPLATGERVSVLEIIQGSGRWVDERRVVGGEGSRRLWGVYRSRVGLVTGIDAWDRESIFAEISRHLGMQVVSVMIQQRAKPKETAVTQNAYDRFRDKQIIPGKKSLWNFGRSNRGAKVQTVSTVVSSTSSNPIVFSPHAQKRNMSEMRSPFVGSPDYDDLKGGLELEVMTPKLNWTVSPRLLEEQRKVQFARMLADSGSPMRNWLVSQGVAIHSSKEEKEEVPHVEELFDHAAVERELPPQSSEAAKAPVAEESVGEMEIPVIQVLDLVGEGMEAYCTEAERWKGAVEQLQADPYPKEEDLSLDAVISQAETWEGIVAGSPPREASDRLVRWQEDQCMASQIAVSGGSPVSEKKAAAVIVVNVGDDAEDSLACDWASL